MARYFPVLFTVHLKAHCSYSLKFFVVKNHLRNCSLSNCSLLGSRFARSCSTRPSQRSKYTEGVARCMCKCTAVQRLSRKYVQKKYAQAGLQTHLLHSSSQVVTTNTKAGRQNLKEPDKARTMETMAGTAGVQWVSSSSMGMAMAGMSESTQLLKGRLERGRISKLWMIESK